MAAWSLSFFLCVLIVIFQCNTCFGCLVQERSALLNIRAAIPKRPSPDPLLTWVDDGKQSDCCAWKLVKCNRAGRVIQLSLNRTYDTDTDYYGFRYLDVSLFRPLEALQHLDLSNNHINGWHTNSGGLERLSDLKGFEILNLEGNRLNSSILQSLGSLKSLKALNLGGNGLGGPLGKGFEKFFELKNLEVLSLRYTAFADTIVKSLGAFTSLKTLILSNNINNLGGSNLSEFEGLTKLSNLEFLDLSRNFLFDFFPLNDLSNMRKLKILDLTDNIFSKGIPPSILSLASLEALSLRVSNLNRSITGLCKLKNLKNMDLSGNKFDTVLPPCFSNLKFLNCNPFSNCTSFWSKIKRF